MGKLISVAEPGNQPFYCKERSSVCTCDGVSGTGAGAAKGRVKTGQELWDVPGVWTECQCLPSVDRGDQVCVLPQNLWSLYHTFHFL